MIKVQRIAQDHIQVINPTNGKPTEMVNVTFIEEGRAGANEALSQSATFLSGILGVQAGLEQVRVHTQPLPIPAAALLKVDQELPGHINRRMYSTPVMRQQIDRSPRSIDGRPTFFATELGQTPEDDKDFRVSNEALISGQGAILFAAQVGATEVRVVRANATQEQVETAINAVQ